MLRFFKENLSFGQEKTVIKILFGIKDNFAYWSDKEKEFGEIRRNNPDEIDKMDELVKILSEAIDSVVNYSLYQKCGSQLQEYFRECIVKELTHAAKQYKSHYRIDFHHKTETKTGFGVTFSSILNFEGHPYGESYSIFKQKSAHFPEELFFDKSLLEKHIIKAVHGAFSLVFEGVYFPTKLLKYGLGNNNEANESIDIKAMNAGSIAPTAGF